MIGQLFIDSGAFGLSKRHVRFDLAAGSTFRAYCDRYATFMRRFSDRIPLFANVDAIGDADKTWEMQEYFEKERGVRPIPVVHQGHSLRHVDRYLENGHTMIALGDMAGTKRAKVDMREWLQSVFKHLEVNAPKVRVHGFGITSWEMMKQFPWWSVDSTSWIKYAAVGWVWVPKRDGKNGWSYETKPTLVNVSTKSDQMRHYDALPPSGKRNVEEWLQSAGVTLAQAATDDKARAKANLHCFEGISETKPNFRIFYAGTSCAERIWAERGVNVLLTYFDAKSRAFRDRCKAYLRQCGE